MAETKFIKTKKDRNYTILDNTFIKDVNLSWKAKGLMAYFLSLPDDWEIHLSEIEKHATDGKATLRSAINELKEQGYLKVEQRKVNGKFAEMIYTIIENPYTEKPQAEKPQAEKPQAEKPPLLNTNNTKYLDIQNTNNTNTHAKAKKKSVSKLKLGDYNNVTLTEEELEKLKKELGEKKALDVINNYSEYRAMKGYKCKSDYLAIKRWGISAFEERQKKKMGTKSAIQKVDEVPEDIIINF